MRALATAIYRYYGGQISQFTVECFDFDGNEVAALRAKSLPALTDAISKVCRVAVTFMDGCPMYWGRTNA